MPGVRELFQGVFILILALLIWRATGSFLGWLALFAPGAGYVVVGLVKVLRGES
jgi:hypothetical protein